MVERFTCEKPERTPYLVTKRIGVYKACFAWGGTVKRLRDHVRWRFEWERLKRSVPRRIRRDFLRWQSAFGDTPCARYAIQNLALEYQLELKDRVEMLCEAALYYAGQRHNERIASATEALQEACRRFVSQGRTVRVSPDVVEFARFERWPVAKRKLPYQGPPAARHSKTDESWQMFLHRSEVVRDQHVLARVQGKIYGHIDAFATQASWVEEVARDLRGRQRFTLRGLAQEVRNGLGLAHIGPENELVEFRLSAQAVLDYGPVLKPTVADAGAFPAFLCSQENDNTGVARRLDCAVQPARGGPEVLHRPLDARHTVTGLRFLGSPIDPPPGIWSTIPPAPT